MSLNQEIPEPRRGDASEHTVKGVLEVIRHLGGMLGLLMELCENNGGDERAKEALQAGLLDGMRKYRKAQR